jgi:catechol 2,3-dioxygenase-like lactoylglutathione lyase family enzyme
MTEPRAEQIAMKNRISGTQRRALLSHSFIPLTLLLVLLNLIALGTWSPDAWSKQPSNNTRVKAVDAVGMTVSDMDRSLGFYTGVLPFEKVSDVEVWGPEYEHLQGIFGVRMRVARLKLGDQFIELTEYLTPKGRPIPIDSQSNDKWFQHIAIVVDDMDKAYEHLRKDKVQYASTAPQTLPDWNKAAAGIKAFYFKDPDGHNLEIIYFPPGKGDPKWQAPTDKLFMGIDHTAIVVGDTDKSLRFYRDLMGMDVKGGSENYGTEQEHLNNVFGAHLEITGLRTPMGPGIEFLEYVAPDDGRAIPPDERANDIMHWQTTLVVDDVEDAARKIRAGDYEFVSSGIVELPDNKLGFRKGVLLRDPDGHVMRIVEK